ncbi:hypothetical protein IVB18_15960 [Bradyrhizobium sp. 186]|uniref:ArnT family glycosyltransferase n=1 Tax=Bradyrhizobium sp. 186 TaxID=2782654 RepID=UPI0020011A65|nr:hypothetical protein [Bradyrhizobium sp. 186]UPK38598.1 hypothetical protein IVB18_15960 [Bradyrhizobium sp. 186]
MLRYVNRIPLPLVVLFYLAIIAAAGIAASYGLENLRVVQVFELDEHRMLSLMQRHLEERSLDPHGFYIYGNLYDSIGYVTLTALHWAGWNVDVHLIGLVLRFLSLCFGVLAALSLAYLAILLEVPLTVAASGSLLLLTMPDFTVYMKTVHPDTLQAALIVVAILVTLRKPGFIASLWGGILAGLAFATKYSGVLVLPICLSALFLPHLGCKFDRRLVARLFAEFVIVVLAFLSVFAFTNPYAVRDFSEFRQTMSFMANYVGTGHGKVEIADPFAWLVPATQEFGYFGIGFLLLGLVLLVIQIFAALKLDGIRSSLRCPRFQRRLILIIFVVSALLHLVLTVRIRVPRYAYHVLPCWIALALVGWYEFLAQVAGSRLRSSLLMSALLIGVAAPQMWYDLRNLGRDTRKPQDPMLVAGNSLASRFDTSQRILADMYTYLPPKFASVEFVGGITRGDIVRSKPDIIIFNEVTTGRMVWKMSGSKFKDMRFSVNTSYGDRAAESKELIADLLKDENWTTSYEDDQAIAFKRN